MGQILSQLWFDIKGVVYRKESDLMRGACFIQLCRLGQVSISHCLEQVSTATDDERDEIAL